LSFVAFIAWITPSANAAAGLETPAAAATFPAALPSAARIVPAVSSADTPAGAASAASIVAARPPDRLSPRRVNRARRSSRARARRDRTVPLGQPRSRAASSFVRPSR
jgi:hypothetical protein